MGIPPPHHLFPPKTYHTSVGQRGFCLPSRLLRNREFPAMVAPRAAVSVVSITVAAAPTTPKTYKQKKKELKRTREQVTKQSTTTPGPRIEPQATTQETTDEPLQLVGFVHHKVGQARVDGRGGWWWWWW